MLKTILLVFRVLSMMVQIRMKLLPKRVLFMLPKRVLLKLPKRVHVMSKMLIVIMILSPVMDSLPPFSIFLILLSV